MSDVTLREAPLKFSSNLDENDAARKSDTLNLIPYAEALRDFIYGCETPLTIGIQGDWGIGRTSLMNMLRGTGDGEQSGLLDRNVCKAINFDSWPYAQFNPDEHMAVECLYAVTNKKCAPADSRCATPFVIRYVVVPVRRDILSRAALKWPSLAISASRASLLSILKGG
jgi:hypothetical protein